MIGELSFKVCAKWILNVFGRNHCLILKKRTAAKKVLIKGNLINGHKNRLYVSRLNWSFLKEELIITDNGPNLTKGMC